jgi:ABC-2 type transport system ATP-binding protein
MALTADELVVIGQGRLIAETTVADFVARSSTKAFRVRVGSTAPFVAGVEEAGARIEAEADGALSVTGMDATEIGDLALSLGVAVYELTTLASLEDAFMEMTSDSVEYRTVS